jgi:hypothetical protein
VTYYHLDLDPDSDPDFDKASTNCIATTNREKSHFFKFEFPAAVSEG